MRLQYAGNVLVYGAMHPCDGDWFGGVNAGNAKKFLEALRTAEVNTSSMDPRNDQHAFAKTSEIGQK